MQIHSEYHGYFLTECIKQNEDSTVYIGQTSDAATSELIIKIFNTQLILLRDRQRFLQEVNVLTSLQHPALLPLLDIGLDKGNPYLIREYAPEGSLITQLAQQEGFAFSIPTIMDILTRIGAAVTYLHQEQVYHGNIKPENILFNANKQALLADIHIASIRPEIPSTVSKPMLTEKGLILWEQPVIMPDTTQDKMQQDIYALSSMAYELLTGYQPFLAGNQDRAPVPPSHWTPSLSERVDRVFLQALSPNPEERFSSAALFVGALQSAFNTPIIKKEEAPLFIEQAPFLAEKQIVSQPLQRQLVPFQAPAKPERVEVARPTRPQSSFGRDLLEGLALLGAQLFAAWSSLGKVSGRRQTGDTILSMKVLIIVLALLLVLVSILIPIFLFHLHANPPASYMAPHQVRQTGHTVTAVQPDSTATSIHHQKPVSLPKPKPTALPVPAIVNASFEVPYLDGDYSYAPDNSGWTFSNDCGIASNGSALTQGTNNAPAGVQVAFVQAYGAIYQNISFMQGTYRVSFLAAQRVNSSSTQSLLLLIDNTVVGSLTPVGGSYLTYSTARFTVGPGIHTLQFKGLKGGGHNTVFIDSVSLIRS